METDVTGLQPENTGVNNGLINEMTSDEMTTDDASRSRSHQTLWAWLGALYVRRRFLATVTVAVAVTSIMIALLLPRYYLSEARLLQPEGNSLSMLSGLSSVGGLGSLLGAGNAEFTRYLSILSSRSMKTRVIEEFSLIRQYRNENKRAPLETTIADLEKNVEFVIDDTYLFLAVRAFDPDPEQAAAMVNFMVSELNATHARLSSAAARQTRLAVERRLQRAETDLDSARTALQGFQEEHGVVELETQAEAFMRFIAESRADVVRAEVQYQTLLQQYGPDNPQARAAREALRAGRAQVQGALGGQDALLPVSMQALPALTRRYAELMQRQFIQAQIIETLYPLYEQAFFQEQNESVAVQVVDEAIPAARPARPSRRLIVVLATISGFLLAAIYVLLHAWWHRNYSGFATELRQAAKKYPGMA